MSQLDNVLDLPIYLVTVKSFTDRHAHMKEQAQRFGLSIEFLEAFDAVELTSVDYSRVVSGCMEPPGVSTVLKHVLANEHVVSRNQKVALVLEDDAILFDGFREKLDQVLRLTNDLEPGWLIFLGGADNKLDSRFFESRKLRLIEKPISTTEAYLMDYEGCARRLAWLRDHLIDKPADHFLQSVDPMLNVKHYWPSVALATQGSITGQFKTALDGSRAKHSRNYLLIRYHYNRLRKQVLPRLFSRFFGWLSG